MLGTPREWSSPEGEIGLNRQERLQLACRVGVLADRVTAAMNSNLPIPALQLEYRNEISPNLVPAFRTLSILAILLGGAKGHSNRRRILSVPNGNQSHFPAYYPPPAIEFALNLVPFSINMLAIVAGSIALSSGGTLRPLLVWAWCEIIVSVCATAFNMVFELVHAKEIYQGRPGYYLGSHMISIVYYQIASMVLPIVLIIYCAGLAFREIPQPLCPRTAIPG